MASIGRARRTPNSTDVDTANLSNVERLILSQAVYEFGSEAWVEVSKLLSKHPMIARPKNFYTTQTCLTLYEQLMDEAGLERSERNASARAPTHLKLAQRYYQRRVLELKDAIAAEEAKFKTLVTEIDEIRAGLWDDKIRVKLGISTVTVEQPEPEPVQEAALPSRPPSVPKEQPPAGNVDDDEDAKQVSGEPEIVQEDAPLTGEADEETEPELVEAPVEPADEPAAHEEQTEADPEEQFDTSEVISQEDHDDAAEVTETLQSPAAQVEVTDEDVEMAPSENAEESPSTQVSIERGSSPEVPIRIATNEERQAVATPLPEDTAETSELLPDTTQETAEEVAMEEPEADLAESPVPQPEEQSRSEVKRKASEMDSTPPDNQRDRKRPREDSEPAPEAMEEDEASPSTGPKPGRRQGRPANPESPVVSKRFQNMIGMLHSQISQHRNGNVFHNPIRKIEAPDYHDIVKRPMDLKTIKSRIKDGLISNSLEFQRDVYLMFANAMMYNRPGSEIYMMAEEMMAASEIQINTFRQTEGFHRM